MGTKTTNDKRLNRLNICKKCENYINLTTTCKLCGCFMIIKTKIDSASCPIGKWGQNTWLNN